ncbi:uncharacterized protein ACOB8E_001455 isoform 1-T10 [Sarcophilus harrisii]
MGSGAWPEREGEAEAGAGGGGEGRRAQPGRGPAAAAAAAAAEEGSGGRSRFIQSEPRSQRAGAGSAARAPAPARPARDKGLLFQASARGRPRRSCSRINQLRRELAPNKAPRGRGGGRGERRLADGGWGGGGGEISAKRRERTVPGWERERLRATGGQSRQTRAPAARGFSVPSSPRSRGPRCRQGTDRPKEEPGFGRLLLRAGTEPVALPG